MSDRKNPFGRGRPWAERTTFQRLSYVVDVAVIGLFCLLVLWLLWLLVGMPGASR